MPPRSLLGPRASPRSSDWVHPFPGLSEVGERQTWARLVPASLSRSWSSSTQATGCDAFTGSIAPAELPLHDAFVFEAPVDRVVKVAELTESVLVRTSRNSPDLQPRTKVNIAHPECRNHDGHHDSVKRFIENPMIKF